MSVDFDYYLKPCANNIDLRLQNTVYSPHFKPLGAVGDVIRRCSSDVACKDRDDVTASSPSSAAIAPRHHVHGNWVTELSPMTSFEQQSLTPCDMMTSYHVMPRSSWTCQCEAEDQKAFTKLDLSTVSSRPQRSGKRCSESVWSEPKPDALGGIHRKLSLPDRLRSLTDLTAESDQQSPANGSTLHRSQTLIRRRHASCGVKFADEVGENLTTFAIIPSRFDNNLSSSPVTTYNLQVDYSSPRASTCDVGDHRQRKTSTTHCALRPSLVTESAKSTIYRLHCGTPSIPAGSPSNENMINTIGEFDLHRGLFNNTRITFSMFFEQPIADRETFQSRLDAQSVCLENVKVVDSPVCGASSSSSSSSVGVLCTAKAKHPLPLDSRSSRRLFARWTNNEWLSHADISAQCITCGGLTGSTWLSKVCVDTYSFAVQLRQPGLSQSLSQSSSVYFDRRSEHSAAYSGDGCSDCRHGNWLQSSTVIAVEFALCYVVDGTKSFWDNNDGRNYRIEWYRH